MRSIVVAVAEVVVVVVMMVEMMVVGGYSTKSTVGQVSSISIFRRPHLLPGSRGLIKRTGTAVMVSRAVSASSTGVRTAREEVRGFNEIGKKTSRNASVKKRKKKNDRNKCPETKINCTDENV